MTGAITVYDPYLYSGKFDTASRRGAGVVVSGNSAYVTETAFRQYANYRNFWVFSNDEGEGNNNTSSLTSNSVNYTRYVSTQSLNLNVRSGAGTNYSIVGKLSKGTAVTVTQVNGSWSYITSPVSGWVSNSYLSASKVEQYLTVFNSTGQTRKTKACYLYSNSNLTGTKYTYKENTTVTILENISSSIDKIRVNATGRIAYISTDNYTSSTNSTSVTSTVGQYKRLANKTYLYSNSNLTGTKYTYLPLTQIKIISNESNTVDYVYVVKTGRYAYVNVSSYK